MPTRSEERQITAIVRGVRRLGARVVVAIVTKLHAELVTHTPVDTGWARANWVPSVGAPVPAAAGSPGNAGAGQAATATGLAQVHAYRLNQGIVYTTNNVPYIIPLNDGHSAQEPAGFVQRAVAEAVRVAL